MPFIRFGTIVNVNWNENMIRLIIIIYDVHSFHIVICKKLSMYYLSIWMQGAAIQMCKLARYISQKAAYWIVREELFDALPIIFCDDTPLTTCHCKLRIHSPVLASSPPQSSNYVCKIHHVNEFDEFETLKIKIFKFQ